MDANTLSAEDIERRLIEEVATVLSVSPAAIRADAPLHSLGLDSMGFVEILVFIEKTFGLRLIESGLTRESFETIRALASCVSAQMSRA